VQLHLAGGEAFLGLGDVKLGSLGRVVEGYRARVREALCASYRGQRICGMPPERRRRDCFWLLR